MSTGKELAGELAELIEVQGSNRCAICFWPLAESIDKGCVRGNCSMRGGTEQEERARQKIRNRIEVSKSIILDELARYGAQQRLEEAKHEWPAIPRDGVYLTLLQWVQGLDLLQRERIAALEREAESLG